MANIMDVTANNCHDFSWCACSHMLLVLLLNKIAAPGSTLPMDASHASMEEIRERGFQQNWPSPPLEPSRCGGTAAPWSKWFDSLLTAAREAPLPSKLLVKINFAARALARLSCVLQKTPKNHGPISR